MPRKRDLPAPRPGLVAAALLFLTVLQAAGQASDSTTRAGSRRPLPVDVEVALARSAAPAGVSDDATVLVLRGAQWDTAAAGSNGVTCLVDRAWRDSLEPICHDPEASRTVDALSRFRLDGRIAGWSETDLETGVRRGWVSGEIPLPTRPAFSYMWSPGQRLWGDGSTPAGRWIPHTMIAVPFLTADDLGLPEEGDLTVGAVFEGGTAEATLVVPAPAFTELPPVVSSWLESQGLTLPSPDDPAASPEGPNPWVDASRIVDEGTRAYRLLDPQMEASLARSAAPPSVSAQAGVWVLGERGDYRQVDAGSNGVQCMVARSLPLALEPICYDPEAARTVMRAELRRFELRRGGMPLDSVEAALHREIGSGRIPVPRRPALSYMMSAQQHLYATEEMSVGRWKPHVMLLAPGLTDQDLGISEPVADVSIQFPGTLHAHVILVVPAGVQPTLPGDAGTEQPEGSPRAGAPAPELFLAAEEGTQLFRGDFHPDGTDFWFFRGRPTEDEEARYRIWVTRRGTAGWGAPEPVRVDGDHSDLYPTVSPDRTGLVFTSYRPIPGDSVPGEANLWWAPLAPAGTPGAAEYLGHLSDPLAYDGGPRFGQDGWLRWTSETWGPNGRRLFLRARWTGEGFGPPELDPDIEARHRLPEGWFVWDVLASPDGQWLAIEGAPLDDEGTRGPSELWLARREGDGWSDPVLLGPEVNHPEETENFMVFSPDSRRLLFVRDFSTYWSLPLEEDLLNRSR